MKISRSLCLIAVSVLVLALTVVSPATASKSEIGPPMQSGTTVTATGQVIDSTGNFTWTFDFDPAGGPVNNSYTGDFTWKVYERIFTSQGTVTLSGYFEGGDGGKVSGTYMDHTKYEDEFTNAEWGSEEGGDNWEGQLYADGTGKGTMGGDRTWSVTFDARAFQSALAVPWDLAIDKIVVLQAVEGGKLVAGKPGAARVFLTWPDPTIDVYVTVDFWVDGKKITSQPANPMIIGNAKKYTKQDLRALKNTANFYIDAKYFTPGEHTFTAKVSLGPLPQNQQHIQDPNPNNNSQELKEQVRDTRGITLLFARIHPDVTEQDIVDYIAEALPFLLDVYPIKSVNFLPYYNTTSFPELGTWTPTSWLVDVLEKRGRHEIVYKLSDISFPFNPGGISWVPVADYAVGLFPAGYYGFGHYGMSYSDARKSVLVATNGPHSLAHEIGHDPLGSTEEAIEPNCGVILHGATIYHGQERLLEDVDVRRDRPNPADNRLYFNFMGAADACHTWVNAVTWNKLVDWLAGTQAGATKSGLSAPAQQSESDTPGFLVGGTVAGDGAVNITTQLRLAGLPVPSPDSDTQSDYQLVALDAAGSVVAWVPLHIDLSQVDPYPFLAALPAPPETTALAILRKDQALLTLRRSSSPPQVSLNEPDASAAESGAVEITWQPSDPDGDALTFMLLFSPDDGKTWLTVATDLTEPRFRLNTSDLPGCDGCRLQVLASDGWNIAAAETKGTFALLDKPPVVAVSYPSDGATIDATQPITLLAIGYDPEDGLLTGDSLSWNSDVDGKLGNGDRLELATLSSGTHQLTAVARDSTGAEARKTLTITVTGGSAPAPAPGPFVQPDNTTIVSVLLGLGGLGACALVGVFFIGVIVLFARRQPARTANNPRWPPPPERL